MTPLPKLETEEPLANLSGVGLSRRPLPDYPHRIDPAWVMCCSTLTHHHAPA
jgi:hypothetical protein